MRHAANDNGDFDPYHGGEILALPPLPARVDLQREIQHGGGEDPQS